MISKSAPFPSLTLTMVVTTLTVALAAPAVAQPGGSRSGTLEEVIVTAQKRAETLQEAPISIAAMGEAQLVAQGVTNLADLGAGVIPSLRIQPFVNSPSTLTIAIRGNGPSDAGQITRESSVAVYIDDVYMSRAQGLAMDVADLERGEVLRGPQGTLFGRNATGGAVRLLSKKPSGEFGLRQQFTVGNFDYFKSATHIDLPEFAGVRTKLDYLHTQKDGWVDNTASGENDFGDLKQDALRFTAEWDVTDRFNVHYAYDWSEIEATQNYFQLMYDGMGLLGVEKHAVDKTRFPILPLDPTETDQQGHALTLTWNTTETITVKSITAYRELDEKTRNNYGGTLLSNGLITAADVEQSQFSQEFQIIGDMNRLNWIVGAYYYDEDAEEDLLNLASLDMFGVFGPPMTPITPPIPSLTQR